MEYRQVHNNEKPAATALVESTGYYDNVRIEDLHGTHFVAVDGDGTLVGYVWAIVDGPHAFLDMLSVSAAYKNTGLGFRLLRHFRRHLHSLGVNDVRFNIHISNNAALRIASKFGALSGYYVLGHAKTGD